MNLKKILKSLKFERIDLTEVSNKNINIILNYLDEKNINYYITKKEDLKVLNIFKNICNENIKNKIKELIK